MANEDKETTSVDVDQVRFNNKAAKVVVLLGALLALGSIGFVAIKYTGDGAESLPSMIPDEIILTPTAEPVVEDVPTHVAEGISGKSVAPTETLEFTTHNISCTILAGNVTTEVERGAIKRGCDYLEMPYIDDIYLCNAVTEKCDLLPRNKL